MLSEIFGGDSIVIVVVIVAVIFGGSMIPKIARNLGSAKNEFEKGLKQSKSADSEASGDQVKEPPKES